MPPLPPPGTNGMRPPYNYPTPYGSAPHGPPPFHRPFPHPPPAHAPRPPHHLPPHAGPPPPPRFPHHRHHASASAAQAPYHRYRSMLDVDSPLPPRPPHPAPVPLATPPQPQPQPQQQPPPPPPLAEEDECPVCHLELPPKGPGGSETPREAHVAACIEAHFAPSSASAPALPPAASSSQPDSSAAGSSQPLGDSVAGPSSSSSAPPSAPGLPLPAGVAPVGRRRATTGMVAYHATEKDCVGEDGAPQECVICFEEFEPGVEMGRLECLCKFHKVRCDPSMARESISGLGSGFWGKSAN